jgi:hypothetical protein
MAQSTPQFTAAQILEAGRRAEADGRLEYAIQFYRHLTDHHARAPEAVAAREGLSRLSNRRPGDAPPAMNGNHFPPPHAPPAAASAPKPDTAAAASSPAPPHMQQMPTAQHAAPPPLPEQARRPPAPPMPAAAPSLAQVPAVQPARTIAISPLGGQATNTAELPPVADDYRAGRLLAKVLSVIGWISCGASVLLLVLSVGAMFVPAASAMSGVLRLAGPATALGGVIGGLVTIFIAQMARALFDTANATRDLAAIERAKAERS